MANYSNDHRSDTRPHTQKLLHKFTYCCTFHANLWLKIPRGRGVLDSTFLVIKNLVKFQNDILPLWRLDSKWHIELSEPILIPDEGEGGLGPNFFWSCQIWGQKIFGIFSFTECSGLWIFLGGGLGPNFFWLCQIWGQNFFGIFSFMEHSSKKIWTKKICFEKWCSDVQIWKNFQF